MDNVEKILKLNELGFSNEQISQIMGLDTTPNQANTQRLEEEEKAVVNVESHSNFQEPSKVVPEVETPQIDYKKLAEEVALLNQRNSSVETKINVTNNQSEKPEVKLPSAEDVILGFLD